MSAVMQGDGSLVLRAIGPTGHWSYGSLVLILIHYTTTWPAVTFPTLFNDIIDPRHYYDDITCRESVKT